MDNREEIYEDLMDRTNYARSLIAYMNYDNPDPKYDGYRQRETKERYGENVLRFLGKIYSRKPNDDIEFTHSHSIPNFLMAYVNYDNEDPNYDGYRQRESKERYKEVVLNSICEANRDIDFDDPNVLFNISSQQIELYPESKRL